MFTPKHFKITDNREILSFIEANAFGQLISTVNNRLFSSHLPFLMSEDKTRLFTHLAKQNPQHQNIEDQEVLVTFQGEHDYISPSWYEGPGVPTWNYQSAHVYGKACVFDDPVKLKEMIETLSQKYESGFDHPWQPVYKTAMLNAIVGIEIQIGEIECKYKLSQNKSLQDRQRVIQNLEKIGANKLADSMKRHVL